MAALIVMEFLLSGSEITNEISESVGLFKLKPDENRRVHDFGEDEVYVSKTKKKNVLFLNNNESE